MLWALLVLAISGSPTMTKPVTSRQADGSWKCSAFCLTSGNDDGGYCRTPVYSKKPTEDACKVDLAAKCATAKPPPGGCRWGSNPRIDSR